MTRTEDFVQSVLGRSGKGNMPFVLAIDLTAGQGTVLCPVMKKAFQLGKLAV